MSKRIRDLKSPVTEWREWLFALVARPFGKLSDNQQFWLGFAVLCLLTTLLIQNPLWRVSSTSAASRSCGLASGRLLARWGGGLNPCEPGDFFAPHDIWLDSRGDLYVSEVVFSAGGNRGLVPSDCHTLQKFKLRG